MFQLTHKTFIAESFEDLATIRQAVCTQILGDSPYKVGIQVNFRSHGQVMFPCVIDFEDFRYLQLDLSVDCKAEEPESKAHINGDVLPMSPEFQKLMQFVDLGRRAFVEASALVQPQMLFSISGVKDQEARHIEMDFRIGDDLVLHGTETETLTSESGNGAKNGYVSAKLHPSDAEILNAWMERTGVTNTIDANELHATLYYAQHDANPVEINPDAIYEVAVEQGVHRMGEAGSEWEALAVHLDGGDLLARHLEISETIGAPHSYADYKAHLSLKYKPEDGDAEKFAAIPFPLHSLRFTNEYQEDIRN